MAKFIQTLIILLNLYQLLGVIEANQPIIRQQRFTNRCTTLCVEENETATTDSHRECKRGCQYFNLEFLLRSRDFAKVDLNEIVERCGSSCSAAYTNDKSKKEQCFHGCNEMMLIQSKAPHVDGLLVYMGATDRNMALLSSNFDKQTKDDWILLHSILRDETYGYDDRSINVHNTRLRHYLQYPGSYCIPTWLWVLPLLLVVVFVWLNYSNYIYNVFIHESIRNQFGLMSADTDLECPTTMDNKKHDAYGVGNEYYFYPMAAVPPPKYDESILMVGSNDDDGDSEAHSTQRQC